MRDEKELSLKEIAELQDVEHVVLAIEDKYGFLVTDQYAADLIAFVDAKVQDDAKWMHVWEGEAAQRVYQHIEAMRAEDS